MSQAKRSKEKMIALQREIEMIEKFVTPLESIEGLEVSWIEGVGKSNGFLSCTCSLEVMHEVLKVYPTTEYDAVLKFAGKEPLETYSPFTIEVNNWSPDYPTKDATVRWQSEELDVWVKIPLTDFDGYVEAMQQQKKVVRRGIETYEISGTHYKVSIANIAIMKYAGGSKYGNSYKTYARDSKQRSVMDEILGVNQ